MIRSTKHHIKDLNKEKSELYHTFLLDYSDLVKNIVDKIWHSLPSDLYCPKYFDYKSFNIKTNFSARILSNATTQASGIVRSCIEKQRRRIYIQNNVDSNVKNINFSKPKLDFVPAILSSKNCDFQPSNKKFYGFIRLKCLGDSYKSIKMPIINHPKIPKIKGNLKGGFMFFKHSVQLSWDIQPIKTSNNDKIIAIDQGLNGVATCSDGQTTPKQCNHGHTLKTILNRLARKKKGSKSFQKTQDHRKNFINWSINQLNFSDAKEVRIEKIININFGRTTSRIMSHWTNTEIRDKILNRCEELEVPVIQQSCSYRSQRCNQCGLVRKSNRNGKTYHCTHCNHTMDSDLNASLNHLGMLPPVPMTFLNKKYNLGKGFFWFEDGFFIDAERRVPCNQN